MGRVDLFLGAGGLLLAASVFMAGMAMWMGRRDAALIYAARRVAPLALGAQVSLMSGWQVALLAFRRLLLPAEIALFGLVLGLGGLAAAVVGALGLWGFWRARAARIIYDAGEGDPSEEGLGAFVRRGLIEIALIVAAYLLALGVSAGLAASV